MASKRIATPMRRNWGLRSRLLVVVVATVVAAGLLSGYLTLVALGALALGYWLVPLVVGPPEVELELCRVLDGRPTEPGDTVTVRTTVRNTGSTSLYGVRVVDGVPDSIPAAGQTETTAARLQPGAEHELEYVVCVRPGSHEYAPARVSARDWSGQYAVETALPVETVLVWSDGDGSVGSPDYRNGTDRDRPPGEGPADEDQSGPGSHDTTRATPARPLVADGDRESHGADREAETAPVPETVVCLDAQRPSRTARTDPALARETLIDCAVTASHDLPGPVWLAVVDSAGDCHIRRDGTGDPAAWLATQLATPETPTGVWPAARREGPTPPETIARTLADELPRAASLYLVRGVLDDRVVRLAHRLSALGYDVVVVHPHAGRKQAGEPPSSMGPDAAVDIIEWSPNTRLEHPGE